MAHQLAAGFRLGPFDVRPRLGTISRAGEDIHVEPKVMEVLLCLAEASGEVVTRDELIARVWRGRMASDEVLSRCVSLLRTSLGDDPREPRFVQTVPRIGYRLLVPACGSAATPATPAGTAPARGLSPLRRPAIAAAAAILLLIALAAYVYLYKPEAGPASVVVLPFASHSADPADEYFSDGLTEELIERLAHEPGLQVVASTSAFVFKNRREDVRRIAGDLGVRYVLQGNVRKEGNELRISAQLIDARHGFHVWSRRFETMLDDIFNVQDEISRGIVAELRPRLVAGGPVTDRTPPTDVMPAYELLLRGRHQLRRREESSIRRSIELFRDAIELDRAFGEAYRELARAYVLLPAYSYEDEEEMFDLAVATIEQGAAVQGVQEHLADDVLALVHFNRWEWLEAEERFRDALAASPNDPSVHQWYSQHLASVGNPEASLREVLEARRLDLLSPVVNDRLAVAYMWVDDDERAVQQFALADELGMGARASPEAYVVLLLRQQRYDEARELLIDLQRFFARAADWIGPFLAALRDPAQRAAAEAALARAAEGRNISLQYLFGAWVFLGNADAAMEVAFELLQEPAELEVEFLFARETAILRCHPRFPELTAAIGLDRYWERYGQPVLCPETAHASR